MKTSMLTILIAIAAISTAQAAPPTVGPAPKGPANEVAARIIKLNFPHCKGVSGALRLSDGSIKANCDDTEYRVFTIVDPKNGEILEVALNCAAAKEHLNVSC